MEIGIINNNLGNVGSVYSAFKFYKYKVKLVSEPEELKKVDMIVLAGVGNFNTGISRLREMNLLSQLNEEVIYKNKPVLGICLGMQLFADTGYENGKNEGLGWFRGKVLKMNSSSVRIPHIGWNIVEPLDKKLFRGILYHYFYYMHSYQFIPEDKKVIKAITRYGDIEIVAALRKNNIVGVQFHPEKSQGDGLRFLRNVVEELK